MPKYLLQVNYTLDGVRGALAEGGSARKAAAQAAAKSAGGKIESFHFAFGSTDAYVIADFPDGRPQPRWRLPCQPGAAPASTDRAAQSR